MEKKQIVVGYKGFNKGLKCKDFQYEVGKEYEQYGELKVCENGFHFCEYPLDILNYYPLQIGNEFAQIEARGEIKTEGDKSATNKIYIKTKLDLPLLIKASIDFIWERASKGGVFKKGNATSGNRANSATSGDDAHSATSGDDAHSATSGNRANSVTSGHDAHSATSGYDAHSATSGYGAHSATSGDDAHSATSG